jgi:hypothetical protein
MKSRAERDTRGGLTVTSKEGEDIVLGTRAALDNAREIRGSGATVGHTSHLLVGVRSGERIRELTSALKHLTLIVRTISDFVGLGNHLSLSLSMSNANKVTEVEVLHAVASRANLTVNLITTTKSLVIESVEDALVVVPLTLNRVKSEATAGKNSRGQRHGSTNGNTSNLQFKET